MLTIMSQQGSSVSVSKAAMRPIHAAILIHGRQQVTFEVWRVLR